MGSANKPHNAEIFKRIKLAFREMKIRGTGTRLKEGT
jgi:hypothetical protein